MMEQRSFEQPHRPAESGNRDILRRVIAPRPVRDLMSIKHALPPEKREEYKEEFEAARYNEHIRKMHKKYEDYGKKIKEVRRTVRRPDRRDQIVVDGASLSDYVHMIQKGFDAIMSTLPPEQQEKLKSELQALMKKGELSPNISKIRQDVVAGRYIPSFLSPSTEEDRDKHEQRQVKEEVGKRLTLIKELQELAMKYIQGSEGTPAGPASPYNQGLPGLGEPYNTGLLPPRPTTEHAYTPYLRTYGGVPYGASQPLEPVPMPDPGTYGRELYGASQPPHYSNTRGLPPLRDIAMSPGHLQVLGPQNYIGQSGGDISELADTSIYELDNTGIYELADTSHNIG